MAEVLIFIFVLAVLAPFLQRFHRIGLFLLSSSLLGVLVYFVGLVQPVLEKGSLEYPYQWANELGVSLNFLVDGLSLFFALLILSFGLLILIYASSYLKGDPKIGRFYMYFLFFLGSMLGLVLASNLISLFVFWELTSFSSYLLIGYYNQKEKSRKAARQALLVTGLGGLAMLAGFVLLGMAGGTYEIPALLDNAGLLENHPYTQAIVLLISFGVFTKSAQFPFHFWLPNAMEAPTPVSAYLHSSTMVKAGIYLIFRLNPLLTQSEFWKDILLIIGAITLLVGAVEAFRSDDLKRVLAYTTISALGLFVLMAGIGSKDALKAAFIYLIAHALYKGGLFLVTGILDHKCGTRNISDLAEVRKKMPLTALATGLACASMVGLIPLLGFLGKEMVYKASLSFTSWNWGMMGIVMLSNVFFVAIAFKIFIALFLQPSKDKTTQPVNEASIWMLIAPLVMGFAGLFIGAFPEFSLKSISGSAVPSILGSPLELDLSLWHGFNFIFILSLATIAIGFILFLGRTRILVWMSKIKIPFESLPEKGYQNVVEGLQKWANSQTRWIQNGYLRNYISIFIFVFIVLVTFHVIRSGLIFDELIKLGSQDIINNKLIILFLVVVTLVFIFLSKSQLMVVAAIGIIGYSIALSYTMYSAPDVAITQFLAESLSLILLILIAPQLPGLVNTKLKIKGRYLLVSILFGLVMTWVTLMGMGVEKSSPLKDYFLKNSILEGKGANAVNVILVDFRALDTLGEISVLAITMVGIISLLKVSKINP
ncbi:proton-conducting transporter membrane subunit [Echinicola jeungdonensis]|uniref:Hydrogen gas-evolving membrane-bound hydrogenase subunit E n=1 Tax=Echinicola jeungdonensis TaxID=709343 RepID=A0ABV5J0I0_9BACT|nr:hydrogen gas-evolving membrane-bound hydrogenase subunit E [Echinicola jeungdonensis]MDN3671069.1 proton-conducting transporter membrane subunit [Echinicola jeungdonensis]